MLTSVVPLMAATADFYDLWWNLRIRGYHGLDFFFVVTGERRNESSIRDTEPSPLYVAP